MRRKGDQRRGVTDHRGVEDVLSDAAVELFGEDHRHGRREYQDAWIQPRGNGDGDQRASYRRTGILDGIEPAKTGPDPTRLHGDTGAHGDRQIDEYARTETVRRGQQRRDECRAGAQHDAPRA